MNPSICPIILGVPVVPQTSIANLLLVQSALLQSDIEKLHSSSSSNFSRNHGNQVACGRADKCVHYARRGDCCEFMCCLAADASHAVIEHLDSMIMYILEYVGG